MNANKQNPIFYSALLRSVEISAGSPRQADAATWQQWLDGAQRRGEFKQSERDWLGVDAWLDSRETVTRDELADFVRANEVQVQDVVLGANRNTMSESEWNRRDELWGMESRTAAQEDELAVLEERAGRVDRSDGEAKYDSYRTPGGENYRDLLLTLPEPSDYMTTDQQKKRLMEEYGVASWFDLTDAQKRQLQQKDEQRKRTPVFKTSHWDEPNVLAHVRFDERTDADGKRVLFLQEIQSDWHQEGRKIGYKTPGEAKDWDAAFRNAAAGISSKDRVPDAPLKQADEWAMLAFKRMARWAVDNGFDRIAWTTGEMAADLFDLSKQVDRIDYTKTPSGDIIPEIFQVGGGRVPLPKRVYSPDELADVVGKEIAERIANDGNDGSSAKMRSLSGDGLKVGGAGMRGFYDRILPAAVNKWAKKFGAKVGNATISESDDGAALYEVVLPNGKVVKSTDNRKSAEATAKSFDGATVRQAGTQVHAIDITPAMREAAMQGQPLFSSASEHVVLPSPKASSGSGITHDLPSRRSATTDAMSAHISRHLGTPYRAEAVVLPKDIAEPLRVFGQVFGKQIVVFRTVEGRLPANGLTVGDGVIYVNEASPSPVLTVAAHELLHEIRSARPDLYAFVREAVEQRADFQRWKAALARRELTSGAWRLSDDKAMEELVADAFGDAMTDPDFLDDLANRNPGKFQAFVAMAVEFFTKIFRALRKPVQRLGSHAFLNDLEGLHRAYAQMLDDYVGSIMPSRSSGLLQFQAAWHGTPHKVDRFRMDKIGTGEGAQAYGWGLYFASAKDVAEHYRQKLSSGAMFYDGILVDNEASNIWKALSAIVASNGDKAAAAKAATSYAVKVEIERLDQSKIRGARGGNLYRVDVPEDADLLDWDKPLSAQPAKVRTALIELGVGQYAEVQVNSATENDRYVFGSDKDAETFAAQKRAEGASVQVWLDSEWSDKGSGKTVYEGIARMFARDDAMWEKIGKTPHDVQNIYQAASEYLRAAGIPGLRYLDGNSRAEGQGSHNYVIWDEAAIGAPVPQFSQDGGHVGGAGSYPVVDRAISAMRDRILAELGMSPEKARTEQAIAEIARSKGETPKHSFTRDQEALLDQYDAMRHPSSKYLFHTTAKSNLASIAAQGLLPGQPQRYEGVGNGRISFAANEATASYYGGQDDVMLRVGKRLQFDDLDADILAGDGTYTTGKAVPASAIEVKVGHKWVPLADYVNSPGGLFAKTDQRAPPSIDSVTEGNGAPPPRRRLGMGW